MIIECMQLLQLYLTLYDPMECNLNMGFSRQEYWSGLTYSPPGDLPNPGIKPATPAAPALQVDSLPWSHQGTTI